MGNTLGAIVFLAAATYLGWTIVRGRAQSFLAAVSGGGSGNPPPLPQNAGANKDPNIPQGGPIAGAQVQSIYDQLNLPPPTVFSTTFGQNGNVGAPGPYGEYSPPYVIGAP